MTYEELMSTSYIDNDQVSGADRSYVIYRNGFTAAEVDDINTYFNTSQDIVHERGLVGISTGNDNIHFYVDHNLRKLNVEYVPRNSDNQWFHCKLEHLIHDANDQHWKFEIHDFSQPIRRMVYGETDHFHSWHPDIGIGQTQYRKLTAICMLSDLSEYTGGEFQIAGREQIILNKGDVVIFPTYMMHRVTAVQSGKRLSLVYRAIGPRFK